MINTMRRGDSTNLSTGETPNRRKVVDNRRAQNIQMSRHEGGMVPTQKLYKVTLKGMTSSPTGTNYGISYIVAPDCNTAYLFLRRFLDDRDIGFTKDREMDTVELIAEDALYPDCRTMLLISD